MPPRDDQARLLDMLIAGRKIRHFAADMTKDQFLADEKTQLAVLHCFMIIGEAANHLSDECRRQLDMIPWDQITRLRNRLAHEYFAVSFDIIWDILAQDLSVLLQAIEGFVPPPDAGEEPD